ncbi:MAG: site-specific DNA-methyltransferase [Phycisphaerae bacterium]
MPTLDWIGKKAVVNHHREVPFRLLKADPSLSVGNPDSGNLLLHGDNLLALKALLPYYAGQVKCIYIDPPYNTGNENWVYNDNVNAPEIKKWLGQTVGKEAEDLSRHDKWLCMMYPRLQLLYQMLREDGAIFISIGQHELALLRVMLDEIFGYSNLLEIFIWNTDGHTENQEQITGVHEYILAYARNKEKVRIRSVVDPDVPLESKIRRDFAENSISKNGPGNPASVIELPAGFPCNTENLDLQRYERYEEFTSAVSEKGYITRQITKSFGAEYPLRVDHMRVRGGKLERRCRVYTGWSSANKLRKFIANNCQPIDDDGTKLSFYLTDRGVIYYRREGRTSRYVQSVLRNLGTTEKNKYELEALGLHFSYPKPHELLTYVVSMIAEPNDLILDSFAGSGTTGHAVMKLNAADGGNRRFILIEMEEHIAKNITAERLKRVIPSLTQNACEAGGGGQDGKAGDAASPPDTRTPPSPGIEIPVATSPGFQFCTLGEPLFNADGQINTPVTFADLARHIFFSETGRAPDKSPSKKSPLIGIANNTAYYLLFNGILGDKRPDAGNVLTSKTLAVLPEHDGPRVIFGEASRLSPQRLARENITFKQLPYEIKTT